VDLRLNEDWLDEEVPIGEMPKMTFDIAAVDEIEIPWNSRVIHSIKPS
jgi:hypothetical protein